jgi:hypothetical protein
MSSKTSIFGTRIRSGSIPASAFDNFTQAVASAIPDGVVSSSAQATTWTVATASFASGAALLNTYILVTSSLGTVTTSATASLATANYFTATASGACAWAFQDAQAGRAHGFVLELTNGGSATQTWPTTVRWPAGSAPTLTASGIDVLTFITDDGGSNWRGVASMLDSK